MLFDFMLRGLFEHRLIHADPNLSNFSFLADGRVVVYDFGCGLIAPALDLVFKVLDEARGSLLRR